MGKYYITEYRGHYSLPFYNINNHEDDDFQITVWTYRELAESILDNLNQDSKDLEKTVPTNG